MTGNLLKINSFIIIFFLFFGCKSQKEKENNYEKHTKVSQNNTLKNEKFIKALNKIPDLTLPITSESFDNCVEFDNVYFNIIDSCNFKKGTDVTTYIDDSISNTNKKNDFYNVNKKDKSYYPIFKSEKGNNIIVGFFIEYWYEDKKNVSIQLNTFNETGNQIDYLIIFNRFKFETLYKYDFEIGESFNDIKVNIYTYNDILYDEKTGDILQEDNKNPVITNITEFYTLDDNGFFMKNE